MKPNVFLHFASLLFTFWAFVPAVLAAPPVNDNFASRTNLNSTFPTSVTGTNVDATEQSGEPLPEFGLSTVWWRWTAAAGGPVEINTLGSTDAGGELDTVLAVYTGTVLTSLTQIAVNDESSSGFTSIVRFTAVAGTIYVIQVLGYDGAEGTVKLNIKAGPPPPANDSFVNAVTLTTGASASGTTNGATLQASEAVPVGVGAADYFGSSWWAWTAPSAGWYRLTVSGGGFYQVASVWTGTAVNALAPVHSSSGSEAGQIELFFQAAAGIRYPIAVGNRYQVVGEPVSLTIISATQPPVYNPSLTVSASAVNITAAPATVNAVFRLVSTEPFARGSLSLSAVSGFFKSIDFDPAQRTSGTSTDGTFTVPIPFPRYLAGGPYRISNIRVESDRSYEIGELAFVPFATGATRTINVTNTGAVDTASPTLTSVSVAPVTVDVTTGPKTLTVTLQISDPLSGFLGGTVSLQKTLSGGGTQTLNDVLFTSAQRTAGTAQNGTYTVPFTIPADALGDYRVAVYDVQDGAGNYADSTDSTDPAFPGPFIGTVRVNRSPVHVLNALSFAPASVNVTTGSATVTMTCTITSSGGEFTSGFLTFRHPTADASLEVSIGPSNRTAGTSASGTYSILLTVPRYFTPGVYAASLSFYGSSGAPSVYALDEFPFPAGAPTSLTVVNTGAVDVTPPVVSLVSIAPNSLPSGSATPLVSRVRVTDDLSGVESVFAYLLPASGDYYFLGSAVRISGTALDGVWEVSAPLSTTIPQGVYALSIGAQDRTNLYSSFATNSAIAAQSVTITAPVSPYTTWTSANSLTGAEALAAADPDHDGTSNLIEFAMGMDPQVRPAEAATAAATGLPALSLAGSGASRRLTLNFWVPDDLLDGNSQKLTYLAQFSSDGTAWTDVPQTSFALGGTLLGTPGGIRRFCTVSDPAIYSASEPRFGRIRVSYDP